MGIPVDGAIDGRTISLALVAIIEPMSVSRLLTKELKIGILVSAILVRCSSRLDNMRRRRFADAQIEKRGDNDASVHDISRVNERFGS